MNARLAAWLGATCLMALACLAYGQIVGSFDAAGEARVGLSFVMGATGLMMALLAPSISKSWHLVSVIWIPAVVFRILLLPAAPSDDVNRYLWEGKLVAAGESPYRYTADAAAWEDFRDVYWEGMNHKDKPTAYPPLSECFFGFVAALVYHPLAFKVAFVLADLICLAGVIGLLRRRGLHLAYAGLYAFSPLVLLAYAAEGHFDVLMVTPLVWALLFYERGKHMTALALASLASGVKWMTLPLLPFFVGRRWYVAAVVGLTVLGLPAVLFWQTLPELVTGLFQFGSTRSFNGPVYDLLLRGLGLPRSICTMMVGLSLLAVLAWRWWFRGRAAMDAHIRWFLGALVLLSPTVHFWYLAWLMPFVALRPSLPWLSFALTSGVYFFVWTNDFWGLEIWQQVLFWLPCFVGLIYELWSTQGRVLWPVQPVGAVGDGVAVVIPTLNAESEIEAALTSISNQICPVDEVIVADASSTDGTVARVVASELPVRVIEVPLGRGQQIAAGMEAASADWVMVLHADCRLSPRAVEVLLAATRANPLLLGGAMGQRFAGGGAHLLLIEWLNDLRSLFTRTAFGDQVQFFHRETAIQFRIMPKQSLMEDVESSWRLRELGESVFLNCPGTASSEKWPSTGWLRRIRLVLGLVARYRWARLKSRAAAEALSDQLYAEYYEGGRSTKPS